jgi:hypothetical protein
VARHCGSVATCNRDRFLPSLTGKPLLERRLGGRFNLSAMNRAVGHFGTFDYQRVGTPSSFTFYSGYTAVSNIDVGAYLYGAGFSQSQAATISNTFANLFSNNAGDPNQAIYRNLGYQMAAGQGGYSCSAIPQ